VSAVDAAAKFRRRHNLESVVFGVNHVKPETAQLFKKLGDYFASVGPCCHDISPFVSHIQSSLAIKINSKKLQFGGCDEVATWIKFKSLIQLGKGTPMTEEIQKKKRGRKPLAPEIRAQRLEIQREKNRLRQEARRRAGLILQRRYELEFDVLYKQELATIESSQQS